MQKTQQFIYGSGDDQNADADRPGPQARSAATLVIDLIPVELLGLRESAAWWCRHGETFSGVRLTTEQNNTAGIREAREVPVLPDLPSVQAGLTCESVLNRNARRLGVLKHPTINTRSGVTAVLEQYLRHLAARQYIVAGFFRTALTSLTEGIIK